MPNVAGLAPSPIEDFDLTAERLELGPFTMAHSLGGAYNFGRLRSDGLRLAAGVKLGWP